jgi:Kdo2-lipid IVA lauroyltransferase/acyltransferase
MNRHLLEDRAASVLGRGLALLPRRAAAALGRSAGRFLADLDRRHVEIALDNLRRAFPHWDEARRLRTARAVYAHLGQVLFDVLWLEGRPREAILRSVEFCGLEHFEATRAAGRGIVFVAAHIGHWEIHAVAHSLAYGRVSVVARPLDNPFLDQRLTRFRTQGANTVIPKRRALASILRALRNGEGVAILIDQNVQAQDGVFVDFFGRPAATTTVAAALALKTGCALVPTRTVLEPDGRCRVIYEPPVEIPPGSDRTRAIGALTQALTRVIEGWVREHPEQWLWIHRRWKTQPLLRAAAPDPVPAPAPDIADAPCLVRPEQ